ncbi:hypothetical protein SAMN04487770_1773, partial [Butyrivibrio sp. ob235]|uniref:hypothetical protein n=2 Tax=Butyrivibrio TaxID=830 RepID=UPI0008B5DFC7
CGITETSSDAESVVVVHEEMHPWGAGAPTDDEDIYFKVVDLNDGSIVTLFKGPQQFFDIYWK